MTSPSPELHPSLWLELWTSLASVLRSYTAVHGLNRKEQATVELGPSQIIVRAGQRWLELNRREDQIRWSLEDLSHKKLGHGQMRFTIEGRLRMQDHEEEMDLQAEAWARELMQ
ncbi:MAG TPA: transcriptional regulator [Acidobacteriaceae bacterium]